MGGDCRGVALLRLKTAFYNRMAINIITDIFIAVYAVLSCDVGYEAQQRYASTVIPKTQRIIIISVKSVKSVPYKFSIVNSQFSIDEICA